MAYYKKRSPSGGNGETAERIIEQGYFSILRWRNNPVRDEAKNVAIILVGGDGRLGGIKSAPISSISQRLREQGILDKILHGLHGQFDDEIKPDLSYLEEMHRSSNNSIIFTEPQRVAVTNETQVLDALYKVYVSARAAGGGQISKGKVLDRVISDLRGHGLDTNRGEYVGDFIFDVTFNMPSQQKSVMLVLTFAGQRKDWTDMEREAGHFLYALENTDALGTSIVQKPLETSTDKAFYSYERVERWNQQAGIRILEPELLRESSSVAELLGV